MQGLQAYQDVAISTQNSRRLIVLLYDGAIKFLKLSIKAINDGDMETKGLYINKAQAIIDELNTVLDMDAGKDIAANLRRLYFFMTRHLFTANIEKNPQKINDVIALLEELNQGWKAIA